MILFETGNAQTGKVSIVALGDGRKPKMFPKEHPDYGIGGSLKVVRNWLPKSKFAETSSSGAQLTNEHADTLKTSKGLYQIRLVQEAETTRCSLTFYDTQNKIEDEFRKRVFRDLLVRAGDNGNLALWYERKFDEKSEELLNDLFLTGHQMLVPALLAGLERLNTEKPEKLFYAWPIVKAA